MDFGSAYIYEYAHSSEEELSATELEEGMWLSDSEGEDDIRPPPPPQPAPRQGLFNRLFGRKKTTRPTGSQEVDDDTDTDTDDDDDVEDEVNENKPVEYVQLEFSGGTNPANAALDQIKEEGEKKIEGSPGKYAQLEQLRREEEGRTDLLPPHLVPNDDLLVTPAAAPVPPPPPPAPMKNLRGILKGSIKKQKKERVRWNASYKRKRDPSSQGIRTRRTDTNVIAIKFNTLAEAGYVHTGDAQFCSNKECGACISHLTKLEGEEDAETKVWKCEYCGISTEVDLVPEEIPTKSDTTYLITPAAAINEESGASGPSSDDAIVVFCIDTSGSMCVTTEVPGRHVLRGAKEKRDKLLQSLPSDMRVDLSRPDLQFMQGQRRDTTWISRMESVQAAVDTQLSRLVHSEPNTRVCLVTFSDDVVILGDGRSVPVTLAGDKLKNNTAVIEEGRSIGKPAAIRDTHKVLSQKVFSLEESGQTALGPAVLASVVIASQVPGSKVIVCTDGLANIGLGSLDVSRNDAAYVAAQNFYDDLGAIAKEKGITVSMLTIKGSDCRVVELGQVAQHTGGVVTLVDPLTVTEEFGSILANPVLATDVGSKIILHNGLYFRSEDSHDQSVVIKQVGNVTADTEMTFEYGVRSTNEKEKAPEAAGGATASGAPPVVPPVMVDGKPHLPVQLQIEYTSQEGDRCLRVITQTKPVTTDRKLAERDMDVGVIGSHVAKQTAELAMHGEFTKARVKSIAAQKMLHEQSKSSSDRRWEYTNFVSNMMPVENELHRLQATELSSGRQYSDDEGEEERYEGGSELLGLSFAQSSRKAYSSPMYSSNVQQPVPKLKMRKSKEVSRRMDMSDDLAVGAYALTGSKSSAFRSPSSIVSAPPPVPKSVSLKPLSKSKVPPPPKSVSMKPGKLHVPSELPEPPQPDPTESKPPQPDPKPDPE